MRFTNRLRSLLLVSTFLLSGFAALPAMAADAAPGGADPAYCRPTTVKAARRTLAERFADANVTHDGKLTEMQAQAVKTIAKNFASIDRNHKGYVTYEEIHVWQLARRAEHAMAKAEAAARSLKS